MRGLANLNPIAIGSCAIALALAALGAAGCGPTSADVEQVSSNQFALRGMVASDRQEIDALKDKVSQLQDQIDEMRHNGAGGAVQGSRALQARVTKLENAVKVMQAGTAPAPAAALGGAAAGTAGADANAPTSSMPPPEFGGPPAVGTGGEGSAAPAAANPNWRASIDSEIVAARNSSDPGAALYLKGLQELKGGQYQDATAHFGSLIRRFPKSPLSGPAEYYSANALYESGKYDQAVLQFNDLGMRFPNGRYTCAALLREGQAFMKINDRIDARLTLQKLINDHADCPESSVASSMIRNLASD